MAKKLFVGALPFHYSNEELHALFAGVGTVLSAVMVLDPEKKRTRGFGFVAMSTPEESQAAIAKLNGMKIGEKNIWVTEARPKKPSAETPPQRSSFSQRSPDVSQRIPGAFGKALRKGFSRPAKWEPRGDGKRSFSSPRQERGDFGPTRDRRPGAFSSGFGEPGRRPARPFGKPLGRPEGGRPAGPSSNRSDKFHPRPARFQDSSSVANSPPKKVFWQKFKKKKP